MYWAIAHFMYRDDCHNCDMNYFRGSLAWAIIFTALIWGYAIIRFFFNPIGGLYMAKRLLIAIILPAAFDDLRFIAPIVNTIIISIVMFLFIVALMSDYMQLYLESINEW